MAFNSLIFLTAFLPVVVFVYLLLPRRSWRAPFLLLASVFFYFWGDASTFIVFLFLSITLNYWLGRWIQTPPTRIRSSSLLIAGVFVNAAILSAFKYSDFFWGLANHLFHTQAMKPPNVLRFRIGISFIVFNEISYLVDIYRGNIPAEQRFLNKALYILFFPKLLAGPFVRYAEFRSDLRAQSQRLDDWVSGIKRFAIGLGKKAILVTIFERTGSVLFGRPVITLTPGLAWLGMISYSLQIYYDFSGYTDMAIGIGRMFGYRLPENFRYPYTADSITDFWNRWHMTLSSWLKDYVYFPLVLGGDGYRLWRDVGAIVVTFLVCGIWHGAQWNYVLWGLYYGLFLSIERTAQVVLPTWSMPKPLRHIYVLAVVMGGWIIFGTPNLSYAWDYVKLLSFQQSGAGIEGLVRQYVLNSLTWTGLFAGLLGIAPLWPGLRRRWFAWNQRLTGASNQRMHWTWDALQVMIVLALMIGSFSQLASQTFRPFIYFKF